MAVTQNASALQDLQNALMMGVMAGDVNFSASSPVITGATAQTIGNLLLQVSEAESQFPGQGLNEADFQAIADRTNELLQQANLQPPPWFKPAPLTPEQVAALPMTGSGAKDFDFAQQVAAGVINGDVNTSGPAVVITGATAQLIGGSLLAATGAQPPQPSEVDIAAMQARTQQLLAGLRPELPPGFELGPRLTDAQIAALPNKADPGHDIRPDEIRGLLAKLTPEQVAGMGPEMQSLHQFKDDPARFEEQLAEINRDPGSYDHAVDDLRRLNAEVADRGADFVNGGTEPTLTGGAPAVTRSFAPGPT